MDNKNVFIAIALSMSVLLFWGAFFESPQPVEKTTNQQSSIQNKLENNNIAPTINQSIDVKSISREDSINIKDRIKVENNSVVGSILLKGALIDDISFKNHKKNLKDNQNVEFLNPRETENGFFVETGWTSIANKIDVPTLDSVWKVIGNKVLSENTPIVLEWNNNKGIIFKKKIEFSKI